MLSCDFAAPRTSQSISTIVVCALHATGDGGPVNFTSVIVTPTVVVVFATVEVVVGATVVLVVVGVVVTVVVGVVDLWLLLLQPAKSTASRIAVRRISSSYVLCWSCPGSSILRSAT